MMRMLLIREHREHLAQLAQDCADCPCDECAYAHDDQLDQYRKSYIRDLIHEMRDIPRAICPSCDRKLTLQQTVQAVVFCCDECEDASQDDAYLPTIRF